MILLAAIAANVPFINERLFCFIPLRSFRAGVKSLWLRLLELVVYFFIVGGIAYLLESQIGNVFEQRWEFFAVTGCLFIVLAYPGFVFRYLRKQ